MKHNEEAPIAVEVIADCIVAIADGVKKLRAGKLNDKALYLLIQHACPVMGRFPAKKPGMAEVKAVIEGMESLKRVYLKAEKK